MPEPAPVLTDRVLAAGLFAVGVVDVVVVLTREGVLVGVLPVLIGATEGRRPAPAFGVAAFEGVDMAVKMQQLGGPIQS